MPQTFIAVQCAFCLTFQGTLDKKVKKFACTICGQKQSFRHVHAISNSGQDIRHVIQELNALRGAQEQALGRIPVGDARLPTGHSDSREQRRTVEWDSFAEAENIPEEHTGCDAGPFVTAIDSSNSLKGRHGHRGTTNSRSKRQRLQQACQGMAPQQDHGSCVHSSSIHEMLQDSSTKCVSEQLTSRPHANRPAGINHRQHQRAQSSSKRATPIATDAYLLRGPEQQRSSHANNPLWQQQQQQEQQRTTLKQQLCLNPQHVPEEPPQHQQQPVQQLPVQHPLLPVRINYTIAAACPASSAAGTHQLHHMERFGMSLLQQQQQQQHQQVIVSRTVQRLSPKQPREQQQRQPRPSGSWRQPQPQEQGRGLFTNNTLRTAVQQERILRLDAEHKATCEYKQPGAIAAASSVWNSFVDEEDACSSEEEDESGRLDQYGYCTLTGVAAAAMNGVN